jgi:hypothetical protein
MGIMGIGPPKVTTLKGRAELREVGDLEGKEQRRESFLFSIFMSLSPSFLHKRICRVKIYLFDVHTHASNRLYYMCSKSIRHILPK